jgi:hypothetical protein
VYSGYQVSSWTYICVYPSWSARGANHPRVQWVPGVFPGVKWLECVLGYTPPSSAEVEVRVELYLYSSFGPTWSVGEWTLLS